MSRTYGSSSRSTTALDAVSARWYAKRVAVVAGPSGSGKSTLLRLLAGLDVPSEGEVTICGRSLTGLGARARRHLRRSDVVFLFQRPSENLVSYLSARQHLRLAEEMRSLSAAGAENVLADLELGHILDRRPHELSGGEQQRLAVAQAAVIAPPLLLLDEPTAELDAENARRIILLLHHAAERGSAVVVTSHDPTVMSSADDIVELIDGRVRS